MNSLIIKTILAVHMSTLPATHVFNGDEADCYYRRTNLVVDKMIDGGCYMNSSVFVTKYGVVGNNESIVFAGTVLVEGKCNEYEWLFKTDNHVKCRLYSLQAYADAERGDYVWCIIVIAGIFLVGFASYELTRERIKSPPHKTRPLEPPPTTTLHLVDNNAKSTPVSKTPSVPSTQLLQPLPPLPPLTPSLTNAADITE